MKKKLLLFMLLAAVGIQVQAADKVPGVIVELASGGTVEIALTDNPKMVFDGTAVKLTATNVDVEYTPTEIAKVRIDEVDASNTAIEAAETEKGVMTLEGGFVRLTGFATNESVSVYSLGGIQLASYKTNSNGSLAIDLSSLPSGISIIKTQQQSIKVTRR